MKTRTLFSIAFVSLFFLQTCDQEDIYSITEKGFPPEPAVFEVEEGKLSFGFSDEERLEVSGRAYTLVETSLPSKTVILTSSVCDCIANEDRTGFSSRCSEPNNVEETFSVHFNINSDGTIFGVFNISIAPRDISQGLPLLAFSDVSEACGDYEGPKVEIAEMTDLYIKGTFSSDFFFTTKATSFPPVDCDAWQHAGFFRADFNVLIEDCK